MNLGIDSFLSHGTAEPMPAWSQDHGLTGENGSAGVRTLRHRDTRQRQQSVDFVEHDFELHDPDYSRFSTICS